MITGNIFLYNGAPIAWKSKLQKLVAHSTAEADSPGGVLHGIAWCGGSRLSSSTATGHGFGSTSPTPVYKDKTACIEWTDKLIGGRERAKHIEIRKHFAHEAAQLGHLRLKRVSTTDQLANVFTKSLQPAQFVAIIDRLLRWTWQ